MARELIDRLSPTARPPEAAIGYQRWSSLTFLHWRVPEEQIAPLLPDGLSVDTFDGSAWVGLVPFTMLGVRPWWFFPVPGISNFHETNVRTYVHRDGAAPGVWFFSLDASNSLAVQVARSRWGLNYQRSTMSVRRAGARIDYSSRRLWPDSPGALCEVSAEIGDTMTAVRGDFPAGQACPGTLEHFLAERYLLYTVNREGTLLRGQVHHRPYPLREAKVVRCRETLIQAAGVTVRDEPAHVLFSEGVDVEVFPLRDAQSPLPISP